MIYRPVRRKKAGFLLIEVLVSVTLISVGLVFVVRSLSISARAIETASRFMKSVSLLEEKLWDIEAKKTIEKGKGDGSFESDPDYTWRVDAEEDEDFPLNDVDLAVEWRGEKKRQRVSLKTYMWNEEN